MNPQQMMQEVEETMEEILRRDKEDEARRERQEHEEECRKERENDKPAWDMNEADYL